jgi:hypothetical protein
MAAKPDGVAGIHAGAMRRTHASTVRRESASLKQAVFVGSHRETRLRDAEAFSTHAASAGRPRRAKRTGLT